MNKNIVSNLKLEILKNYNEIFHWKPLPIEVKEAFELVDRHNFVSMYKDTVDDSETLVTESNISEHLTKIYRDQYLIIKTDRETNEVLSSLSQPSLVLYMLAIGDIRLGDSILEIGTASGWNAALLSNLVGASGRVVSTEIDGELGVEAKSRLKLLGYDNVRVKVGDGARGAPGEKFDVIFYTVGIYDIPSDIYDQLKEKGILVLILKNKGGGDTLIKLRKSGEKLVSEESIPCGFVEIQGHFRTQEMQPKILCQDLTLKKLWSSKTNEQKFWFGGSDKSDFYWRSMPFKAYLSIVNPYYFAAYEKEEDYKSADSGGYFGIYNRDEFSLAVFTGKKLIGCGSDWAFETIKKLLNDWVDIGMPTISSFHLEVCKKTSKRKIGCGEYLITRDESKFFFNLK
ncbi:hypothetical protein F9L16_02175 [Agarivorans sp. B2Z047]|uniref:protein-L-isoaspartate O-methyltransferase family protein n=1 Tax=Agarivorans sp. B2Z047 TaxID=2652721 RepID=UPI00128E07AE|nr:hypothetical protein [Agarivorans sp. B2Z047]MPW27801.1 hypothetical protein [Agarivorans sp. B2Z047]UQN44364.1 hypothetical protein LQZ07_07790 [Agarivorans sp. B2Z047]